VVHSVQSYVTPAQPPHVWLHPRPV
jgi:hypothetical protein